MPAIAEVPSTSVPRLSPLKNNRRASDRTTCPVCADSMVAAEASAFVSENLVNYLWTCDTCGYGFVTSHSLKRYAAA
jgi:C4-type Zn-finger protein